MTLLDMMTNNYTLKSDRLQLFIIFLSIRLFELYNK